VEGYQGELFILTFLTWKCSGLRFSMISWSGLVGCGTDDRNPSSTPLIVNFFIASAKWGRPLKGDHMCNRRRPSTKSRPRIRRSGSPWLLSLSLSLLQVHSRKSNDMFSLFLSLSWAQSTSRRWKHCCYCCCCCHRRRCWSSLHFDSTCQQTCQWSRSVPLRAAPLCVALRCVTETQTGCRDRVSSVSLASRTSGLLRGYGGRIVEHFRRNNDRRSNLTAVLDVFTPYAGTPSAGRDVAKLYVFVVDSNAVLFNRARINNWQQAHVEFRTAASAVLRRRDTRHGSSRNRERQALVIGRIRAMTYDASGITDAYGRPSSFQTVQDYIRYPLLLI